MGELRNRPTKLMRARAQSLRKAMTDEETMLWYELRELKEFGHKFRKQVPIGKYVADFACLNSKLIIEVDGIQHADPEHLQTDKIRDQWLKTEGYTVLRFWNDEIRNHRTDVIDVILANLPLEGGGGRSAAKAGGGESYD